MEVQQNLLPRTPPEIEGIDTAGKIIYCDETGGDYYDYLVDTDTDGKSLRVIVGDVSGHGIASALLMATVRAFLRQRSALGGQIGPIVTDVNRQLVEDVEDSGRFVTLFYLLLDLKTKSLQWIRAGHDPGMLYDPVTDSFFPLHGPGIALGISKAWEYELQEKKGGAKGQIILLGTDGIREARNPKGQMFGTDAIRESIRQNASKSSEEILNDIFSRVQEFKQGLPFEDDLTAVVIKITQ
jgi:sigma-B regulation protein RsbU (phosphoserine phosphatase)